MIAVNISKYSFVRGVLGVGQWYVWFKHLCYHPVLVWLGGPALRVASDYSGKGPCSPVLHHVVALITTLIPCRVGEVHQCVIILCIVCICMSMYKVASLQTAESCTINVG